MRPLRQRYGECGGRGELPLCCQTSHCGALSGAGLHLQMGGEAVEPGKPTAFSITGIYGPEHAFLTFFFCFLLTFLLKTLQCSVSCGYGIQSRVVTCMGPSQQQPLSPLLCMHMPKPITIRSCSTGTCREDRPVQSQAPPRPTYPSIPPDPTEASTILQNITTPVPTTKQSQHTHTLESHSSSQTDQT